MLEFVPRPNIQQVGDVEFPVVIPTCGGWVTPFRNIKERLFDGALCFLLIISLHFR